MTSSLQENSCFIVNPIAHPSSPEGEASRALWVESLPLEPVPNLYSGELEGVGWKKKTSFLASTN